MPAIRSLSAAVIFFGAICSAFMPQDDAAYPAYWPGEGRQAMYGEAGVAPMYKRDFDEASRLRQFKMRNPNGLKFLSGVRRI